MPSHSKPKVATTGRNDERRCGKKWKEGKSPQRRADEAKAATAAKAARKAEAAE
jgi:hypothetical protein